MAKNTVRVTLDLGPDSQSRLGRLLKVFRESKKVEIFRKALQWLEFVVDAYLNGGKIFIRYEDGTEKELAVLGLKR